MTARTHDQQRLNEAFLGWVADHTSVDIREAYNRYQDTIRKYGDTHSLAFPTFVDVVAELPYVSYDNDSGDVHFLRNQKPTPWRARLPKQVKLSAVSGYRRFGLVNVGGAAYVAENLREEWAQEIMLRVNAHDALVAALTLCQRELAIILGQIDDDELRDSFQGVSNADKAARAALAAAKGEA
jgi:hypothetical protein